MAKRFIRRKRKMKRKIFRRKRSIMKSRFEQDPSVKIESRTVLVSEGTIGSIHGIVSWGDDLSGVLGWPINNKSWFNESDEWAQYAAMYEEYKIVGMKIEFSPAQQIGDSADSRQIVGLHVGTSIIAYPNFTDINQGLLQKSKDYKMYSWNGATRTIKRYYKISKRQKNLGDKTWLPTSNFAYSNALTYYILEVYNATVATIHTYGRLTTTYYIKFRHKRIN